MHFCPCQLKLNIIALQRKNKNVSEWHEKKKDFLISTLKLSEGKILLMRENFLFNRVLGFLDR